MKRRNFLKSMGAAAVTPLLPLSSLSPALASAAAPVIPATTYKWAEVIVRAHNSCNLAMLQRHLKIDASAASLLKSQLLQNGVIAAEANAFGIHKAMDPILQDGVFKPANIAEKAKSVVETITDQIEDNEVEKIEVSAEEPEPDSAEIVELKEVAEPQNDISGLDGLVEDEIDEDQAISELLDLETAALDSR